MEMALTSSWGVYGLAVVVILVVYALIDCVQSFRRLDPRRIERRLIGDLNFSEAGKKEGGIIKDPGAERRWAMARWLAASQSGMSFRKLCVQAAVPWPAHQILVYLGCVLAVFLIFGLLLHLNPPLILLGAAAIVLVPMVVILRMRNARLRKFNNQMPEALELLSQALRAGHSLAAGIQLIAEQMPDPIGTEFQRVYAEQDLGIRLEDALKHLADRIDMLDVKMFVTAILIQRQTGGDLTELMDRIGTMIRDRIRILGHVRTLTAEGRLSGWILIGLPIGVLLMLFVINPEYPRVLFTTRLGHFCLLAALVMQTLGIVFVRRIVSVKA